MTLSAQLLEERGMPGVGFAIWRRGEKAQYVQASVGEFLAKPENQSGTWLIDGGWGGPPGPVHVRWNGLDWDNGGFGGCWFAADGEAGK